MKEPLEFSPRFRCPLRHLPEVGKYPAMQSGPFAKCQLETWNGKPEIGANAAMTVNKQRAGQPSDRLINGILSCLRQGWDRDPGAE